MMNRLIIAKHMIRCSLSASNVRSKGLCFPIAGLIICLLTIGCASTVVRPDIKWPSPPEKPRIEFVEILEDENYFGKPFFKSLSSGILGASARNQLMKPYGVTVDSLDRVYVTDTGLGAVLVFDKAEKKIRHIGAAGQGKLVLPTGIIIANNLVFVSDTQLQRVYGYDFEGNLEVAIGDKEEFKAPSGLAFDPSAQKLYVANSGMHTIRVYSPEGTFLSEFGSRGSEDGQFNYPTNLFIRQDKLYVVDTMNFRVQIFDLEGKFLSKFGAIGNRPGQFSRPKGIGVNSQGLIVVADAAFDNFQIFNEEGEIYLFVGNPGYGPGSFSLPAGLYIDEKDYIYVVDQLNTRVQVFKFLEVAEE